MRDSKNRKLHWITFREGSRKRLFFVNILWAKYLGHSLVYPTAALVFLGALVLWAGHRKISGPHWEGDTENELIENLAEDMAFNFNWKDRVTWLCFVSGAILLLILLLR